MDGAVTHLWRHPIKAHGAESVDRTVLTAGRTMPWDRVWAIGHEAAKPDSDADGWRPCVNFSRGAKSPELMAIGAQVEHPTELRQVEQLAHVGGKATQAQLAALAADGLEGLGGRGDLGEHVDAVHVLVDLPLQASHLALDAPESGEVLVFGVAIASHRIGG